MRTYLATHDVETVQAEMATGASIIADVLPEVRDRLPHLPPPPLLTAEHARFRFFDSFTGFLKNAAKSRQLVIILDDLHWADTPSLLLLQFVARELCNVHALVCGTYRDVAFEPTHPFSRLLGELARLESCQTLFLQRFTKSEIHQFVTLAPARAPSSEFLRLFFRKRKGIPFLSLKCCNPPLAREKPPSLTVVRLSTIHYRSGCGRRCTSYAHPLRTLP